MTDSHADDDPKPEAIHLHIPSRYLLLPAAAAVTGLSIGLIRGSRAASWRFLAENAHRPPRTVQGWYFYKKTKNYKMMLGGLKAGGADALRLGAAGLAWVALEDGMDHVGLDDVREVGAGAGSAALFSLLYRLPWAATSRSLFLGLLVGGLMRTLRWGQGRLKTISHMQAQAGGAVAVVGRDEDGASTPSSTASGDAGGS